MAMSRRQSWRLGGLAAALGVFGGGLAGLKWWTARLEARSALPPVAPDLPILDARASTPTRCEIHGRPLVEGLVPIRRGLRANVPDEPEPRRERFPYAFSSYNVGCVGEESEARVRYCPACRQAERAWKAKPAPGKAAVPPPVG